MNPKFPPIALLAVGVAVLAAGCGSSSNNSSSASTSTGSSSSASSGSAYGGSGGSTKPASSTTAAGGGAATVAVSSVPKLGQVIVNSKGVTLYDFHKDKGTTSACYGSCASVWPPLLTSGAPKATGTAEASLLGTTKRTDGTVQVTYNGHPLYTYVSDKKPGDATGNDTSSFGAQWYVLSPKGEEPED